MFPDRLKCSVTEKDIKNGRVGKCGQCPAALAICHALVDNFIEFINVEVYSELISIDYTDYFDIYNKKTIRAETPRSVSRFIKKFDGGKKVEPMNFVLRLRSDG